MWEVDMFPVPDWPTTFKVVKLGWVWLECCWFHACAATWRLLKFVRSVVDNDDVAAVVDGTSPPPPTPLAKLCWPDVLLLGVWFRLELSSPTSFSDVTNEWRLLLLLLAIAAAVVDVVREAL